MNNAILKENLISKQKLEMAVFFSLVIYQTLIVFSIPTDINGDPNDYIRIARNLSMEEVFSGLHRFVGYPLFIKLVSLNLAQLNLVFIGQLFIYLISLRIFASSISSDSAIRAFIFLPGFLPSIAYLPKLLFPDCLLLSIFLIFSAALLKKRFLASFICALSLIFIKLAFVFTFFFCVAFYFSAKFPRQSFRVWQVYILSLILLIPAVFFIAPFSLYQTTVQNPSFVLSLEQPNPYPITKETQVKCNNTSYFISDYLDARSITEHSSDVLYMPIGQALASKWSCTNNEIKSIQRELILKSITSNIGFHTKKFFNRYLRNLFVVPDAQHIWWMLDTKLHLQVTNSIESISYSQSELDYFRGQDMNPLKQPNLRLLASMVSLNPVMEKIFSYIAFAGFVFNFLLCAVFRKIFQKEMILLGLLASYSFVICLFAFGYDRYVFVNLFFWFGIVGLTATSIKQRLSKER